MSNYIMKPIGEMCDIRRGASPRPIDEWMSESGVPWVKIADATKNDSRFIYETEGFIRTEGKDKSVEVFPEDLIISNSATPALPKIMKIHACIHDGWLLAQNFKGITRDYLYYQVKYLQKYLINQGNGSIFKNLKTDILKEFPIHVPVDEDGKPDISLQNRITDVLKSIEDKLENNNHIISELESLTKTIYDYWFLQFEFPNEEGKPYKSSGGKMVWNEELKREIPEGWEVKDFLEVCEWEGTSQPPKSVFVYEYKDGYIRFIQNRDYSDPTTYPTYIPIGTALGVCDEKDILMDKYGDAGAVRFGLSGAYNVALSKIIVKDLLLREYIRSFLESKHVYNYLHNSSMASTRASLNENNVSYLKVVIPPNEILQKFNNIANLRIETKLKNDRENQQLSSLRDWLLPMLMNGQVTFKEENAEV